MASRNIVHHGELRIFKEYLIHKGFEIVPINGQYEVLRARYRGKKKKPKWTNQTAPLILYERPNRGCNYTIQVYYETIMMSFYMFAKKWYQKNNITDLLGFWAGEYENEKKEYLTKWEALKQKGEKYGEKTKK